MEKMTFEVDLKEMAIFVFLGVKGRIMGILDRKTAVDFWRSGKDEGAGSVEQAHGHEHEGSG